MVIDVRGIATGKTYDLLMDAVANDGVIVCYRTTMGVIKQVAENMGFVPPKMITHKQLIYGNCLDGVHKPIFIDDARAIFHLLARGECVPRVTMGRDSGEIILTGELAENHFIKQPYEVPELINQRGY